MLISFALAGLTLVGCSNTNQQNEDALLQENRSLRDRLDQTQLDYQAAQDENRRLQFQMDEASQRLSDQAAMPPVAISEFGPGVEVFQRGNEMVVRIQGDVLFDSGQDSLRTAARTTLSKIATELQSAYPNTEIRVTGFTDTDPIKKSGYKSNYHLGFARAYAVGQYLGKHGISPNSVSYASFGPDDPLSSKTKSRRVEVSVFSE
jgi:flagellar motor protein MotB